MTMEQKLMILLGPGWMAEVKKCTMRSMHGAEQENEGEQEFPRTES